MPWATDQHYQAASIHGPLNVINFLQMIKLQLILFSVFLTININGQSPKNIVKKLGSDPVFFLDSVQIDKSEMMLKIKPTDVASVTVYKAKEAFDILGEDGKDGVVFIFTKSYAKEKYWNYFKSKSKEYLEIVPSPSSDSSVQYILNKRILTSNFEGDLMQIGNNVYKEIKIINKETLAKEYNIFDKTFGIIILSDRPDNLYNSKKKF